MASTSGNQLEQTLVQLRASHKRNYWKLLVRKLHTLNECLAAQGFDTLVVRAEPGLHSQLALQMAWSASKLAGSPVRKLIALCTSPANATPRPQLQELGFEVRNVGAGALGAALLDATNPDDRASDPGLATTMAMTALLQLYREAHPSWAVLGFIDRDQAAYLGEFHPGLEGACDVQLFTDLHRSELFELAKATDLAEPLPGELEVVSFGSGAVRVHSDEMELYARLAELPWEVFADIREGWSAPTQKCFAQIQAHVAQVRAQRARAYVGCSPSIHLDFRPPVPGGWTYKTWN
jgi:NAD+ synthase (glutamine-hydrolysing)